MQNSATRSANYGPWLVGLGAALWGTESAWRIPLNELFDAKVIVFWEHVLILIMFLPILIPCLREIPKVHGRTWGYLSFFRLRWLGRRHYLLHPGIEVRESRPW